MNLLLVVRSLLFLILIPGTVAGYIPFRILHSARQPIMPSVTVQAVLASGLALLGVSVLVRCVWDFFAAGHGTLAPFDPPKHLVVRGLYRFTRNPMYHGVLALLLGEAWLFRSASLFEYAIVVFVIFHLVVVIYEEPALESRFAESYLAYRVAVPRWGFKIRPIAAR
jgi:protein-S-isoprenylcysteine O-methyltransferase Ste14